MSILSHLITNSTELTGLLSFGAATIACLIAARRSGSRDARMWKVLALMCCLFFIEVFLGLRYRIIGFAINHLKSEGIYAKWHGSNQEIIIASITTIALVFVTFLLFRSQIAGGAARITASIIIAVIALFAIETVSLHALDAVFYRPIGPVLTIGWIWALAAVGICLASIPRSRN